MVLNDINPINKPLNSDFIQEFEKLNYLLINFNR